MDLISRDKAQDAIFSKEDIRNNMDGADDGDINRTIRSAIRLIEGLPSAFEGMTNGEVIQALFPEVKVEINGFLVRCVFIEHEFTTLLEWWNAPYNTESEE